MSPLQPTQKREATHRKGKRMTQDDRMETITDPEQIRAVWEAGDMGEESLGGDSESGTYNRSNRPPAGPRPDADNPWALLPDDHPKRPKQCGGCGTKWVDAETARACERRHGDDIATTPAPVGAAVALDLDALHETICDKFTGMAEVRQAADLLVSEVSRLTEEAATQREWFEAAGAAADRRLDQSIAWMERAEAAEAEVRRLTEFRDWWKASSLANAEDVRRLTATCHDWRDASDLRAALATTGEGQHVAREVFTADGIPFVRCSCTNAKSPTSSRWLSEHVPNGGVAELQAVVKRQAGGQS